ncbi:MAG: ABC transporter permease subunit [Propionibacteriaceae bacterium]|nr:ABC transporter permease subunit [Propionibacteriaceae bacterium]
MPTTTAMVERKTRSAGLPAWLNGVLGLLPYAVFVGIFLIVPILANLWLTFMVDGAFSTDPVVGLFEPSTLEAFLTTFNLSWITALLGGVLGLAVTWAIATLERPAWLRTITMSYSAVASQLGGVALAFAFIATLGTQGLVTVALQALGVDITGFFQLTGFSGLIVVYLYFQIPLMTVLMLPAIGSIKQAWYEAATSLGAKPWHFVRDVVIPVLWPSIAGALLLLFANAFAAYATAYALTGGSVNLVPILVGFNISGNVFVDENFAAALVTGMMVIILAVMGARFLLERKSNAWLQQ